MKIVFICTGNTCRSQIAAQYMKSKVKEYGLEGVQIGSFGLIAAPESYTEPKAVEALKGLGVRGRKVKAKQFTLNCLGKADYIFTMTASQSATLRQLGAAEAVPLGAYGRQRDVGDPFGQSQSAYNAVAEEIAFAVNNFIKSVFNIR